MKAFDKLCGILSLIARIIATITIIFMVALVCTDVGMRLIAGKSILGTYDIVGFLMGIVIFAGFVCGQRDRELLHATFFVSKMPGKMKYIVWSLGYMLSTAICLCMGVGTFIHAGALKAGGQVSSTIRIPVHPFYYIAAVLIFATALLMVFETIKTVLAIAREDYAADMRSQWGA